ACLEACPVGGPGRDPHPELLPRDADAAAPPLTELLALDDEAFLEHFRGRPIMRAKRDGLVRNACIALGNTGVRDDFAALVDALDDTSPLVRGHAAWAIGRMAERDVVAESDARPALERRLVVESDPFAREEIHA